MYPLQVCLDLKGIEHVRTQLLGSVFDLFEMGSFLASLESKDSTTMLDAQGETQILRESMQAEFEKLISSTSEKILSQTVQKVIDMVSLGLSPSLPLSLSLSLFLCLSRLFAVSCGLKFFHYQ